MATKSLEKKVEFSWNASSAARVSVAGTFNNWNTDSFQLKKSKQGTWSGQFAIQPGRYEYRYFVDGQWESDPAAPSVPNEFGSTNCVLEVK